LITGVNIEFLFIFAPQSEKEVGSAEAQPTRDKAANGEWRPLKRGASSFCATFFVAMSETNFGVWGRAPFKRKFRFP